MRWWDSLKSKIKNRWDQWKQKHPPKQPSPPMSFWEKIQEGWEYFWTITQVGLARGHAFIMALNQILIATDIIEYRGKPPPTTYIFFSIHTIASVLRRAGAGSKYAALRFSSYLSEVFQERTLLIPLLVSIGGAFGVTNPAALIAIFCASTLLSIARPSLDEHFNLTPEKIEKLKSENKLTWWRRLLDKIRNPFIPMLKRAGQGALEKETIKIFIEALADAGLIASDIAASNPALLLFVLEPFISELGFYLARQKLEANDLAEKILEPTTDKAFNQEELSEEEVFERKHPTYTYLKRALLGAPGEFMESSGYTTKLTAQTIAATRNNYEDTDNQYFGSMGGGAGFGVLAVLRECDVDKKFFNAMKAREQRKRDAAIRAANHEAVNEIPIEMQVLHSHPRSLEANKSAAAGVGGESLKNVAANDSAAAGGGEYKVEEVKAHSATPVAAATDAQKPSMIRRFWKWAFGEGQAQEGNAPGTSTDAAAGYSELHSEAELTRSDLKSVGAERDGEFFSSETDIHPPVSEETAGLPSSSQSAALLKLQQSSAEVLIETPDRPTQPALPFAKRSISDHTVTALTAVSFLSNKGKGSASISGDPIHRKISNAAP